MKILESAENYLETILILQKKEAHIHAIHIANHLGFSKPSVSIALKQLETNGYIMRDSDAHITLTHRGLEIAKKVYERHSLLTKLFIKLGVSNNTAEEDACKVEHCISQETFDCIKKIYNEVK